MRRLNYVDQLAKPIFRFRYDHTPVVMEQSEGPLDTVASNKMEPRHEKTWHRGLRPDKTQIGLCSHRD